MSKKGKLYLFPSSLGEKTTHAIPELNNQILDRITFFIAERAKTARHFIKACIPGKDLSPLRFSELNKRTRPEEIPGFLQPCLDGHDMGLLSEAGCPGVADPGAVVVQVAHQKGIQVVPLTGPSSILLALMASGMNGQQFCFQGYLSPKKPELAKELKRLEQLSAKFKQTQIFIETPYRNNGLVETALQSLDSHTQFCIAVDLTLPEEFVQTHTVAEWKKRKIPDLHKRPAIFLLLK
jgi:16S rRNA (cytidine1402-2'-O)-methyltransferase